MKRNNEALYESIMKNVSKEVKKALNEEIMNNKSPFCNLTIELSDDPDGNIYAYIGDDCGGEGISLEDVTGEGLAEQIKQEIIEYIDSNWDPQLSGGRMSFPRSSIAD